jgi:MFS family permease
MLAGCLPIIIAPSATIMYVTLVLFSIGNTVCGIGNLPMYTDHMPSDKFMATVVSMAVFQFTISSIFGPALGGWVVELGGNDYSLIWVLTLGLMFLGALLTLPIKFGEAHKEAEVTTTA